MSTFNLTALILGFFSLFGHSGSAGAALGTGRSISEIAPAPEASSVVGFSTMILVGGVMLFLRKRAEQKADLS